MARPKKNTKTTGTKPTHGVGYIRVSKSKQELSPEAQREAIEQWANREGVTVVSWHEDKVSGAAPLDERLGLLAALDALDEGQVLLIAKWDRLARDVALNAMILGLVERAGASVVSADGAGNGDQPSDELMRNMLAAFARYERQLIRGRTKAALQAKKARGERVGKVPFGFVADEAGRLHEDAGEQEIIKAVVEGRTIGMTLQAITDELAAKGYVSRAGKPLGLTQVARICKREAPGGHTP